MNVNSKYVKLACVALVMGITSCSKEQITGEEPGEMTTLSLNLSYAQGNTRATDANATNDETAVKTIDIFIFDATTSVLVNHKRLSATDIEEVGNGNNAYKNKDAVKIETTVGAKKIAIGANLPSTFPNVTSIGTLKQTWEVTLASLTSTSDGFMMFSQDLVSATLVTKNDQNFTTNNTVKTTIERVVAKVGVKKDANLNLDLATGKFNDPSFAIRRSNKKMFPLQLEESNVVKTPTWNSTYAETNYENFSDYAPISENNNEYTKWNVKYATENTSENPNGKNSTYASIKVQFIPKFFHDGTGKATAYNGAATDFWTVKDKDGNVFYFNDFTIASNFASTISSNASERYTSGFCYYSAYLNPDNNYSTIRNNFYVLNIKSFVPPGSPTPEPSNPDGPLSEPTDMHFETEIAAWGIVSKDYELL
jgi:hypothetical protein